MFSLTKICHVTEYLSYLSIICSIIDVVNLQIMSNENSVIAVEAEWKVLGLGVNALFE